MQKSLIQKLLFFVFPLLLLLVPVGVYLASTPLIVFPNNTSFITTSFTDSDDKGNTEINSFATDNEKITLTYTLKEGYAYPYAGLAFDNVEPSIDLSGYDYFVIKADSSPSRSFFFSINTHVKDVTIQGDVTTQGRIHIEIPTWQEKFEYCYYLNELSFPFWWLENNSLSQHEEPEPDYSRVYSIVLDNSTTLKTDVQDTINIYELSFHKSVWTESIIVGEILLLYYLILLLRFISRKYNIRIVTVIKQVVIPYQNLKLESYYDQDLKNLIEYLGKNYHDPDISIDSVSGGTGISTLRIPALLKEEFNLSFPKYLNVLRQEEAKHLLRETDRQITDIAFAVGYNNLATFYKNFKQLNKINPKQFRQIYSTNKNPN